VTDGQTDGRAIALRAIASRVKSQAVAMIADLTRLTASVTVAAIIDNNIPSFVRDIAL